MNYQRFIELTKEYWNKYYKRVVEGIAHGEITPKGKILFPNILLVTKSNKYFAAELIGAKETFDGLTVKEHYEPSINRYLNQFSENPSNCIVSVSENMVFQNICFTQVELSEIESRFPFVRIFKTFIASEIAESIFLFGKRFNSLRIENCLLVNAYLNAIRAKHILYLTVIKEDVLASEYKEDLIKYFNSIEVHGIHTCLGDEGHSLTLASQFTNAFLFPKLHETTLGEFLKTHPEIIKRALRTKKFLYEPYLPWLETHPNNTDEAINPDLMVERPDGFYDIYELKLALLNKTSITKGKRKRRDFIEYVSSGIGQLANYEEYFSYKKNCDYAFEKYGIKVKNPNLILVVGNFDNTNKAEVEESCRQLKENISIIDYDSLLQLFLLSSQQKPASNP